MAEEKKQSYNQYEQQIEEMPAFNYNQFVSDWKEGGKPIVEAIMSNYSKPEPQITPEQEKRAKFASALTDSFSSLAEMFAHGQGAHIRNREGNTSSQTTNARLDAIRDKYNNDLTRYQTMRGNAEMQDFNQMLKAAMDARGEKRQWLMYKDRQTQEEIAREQDRQDKLNYQKKAFDNEVKLIKERARANPPTKPGPRTEFYVTPNKNNTTTTAPVVTREYGERRQYTVTPAEKSNMMSYIIKSRPDLLKKYGLLIQKKVMDDDGRSEIVTKYADEDRFVDAYLQEYENGTLEKQAPGFDMNNFIWRPLSYPPHLNRQEASSTVQQNVEQTTTQTGSTNGWY
ncbi:hypothetical protein D0T49_03495 [Paludibacter sp. 221]|uniref:hypothetical protein n=1 Tax=Paludibacter sp. 221 TaxID=2302939 RepID=UPI0013D301F0|nr:hypothetical protein [Paludibacter sp. 221]NDV46105.1 hypothetical protein [Paludibacter sp. 221]